MPIYEYQCKACGHKMEAFQSISEAVLKNCPICSKRQLQKLVSAAGFQLKGGGWYATDYSSKGSQKDKRDTTEGEAKKTATEKKEKEKKTDSDTVST